jgi:murein DD-endopeptidase MepM/ murein hydrolase activator NlpD
VPPHRAAKHRSAKTLPARGVASAMRPAGSGRRRTGSAIVAATLVLVAGGAATAVHLRAPGAQPQAADRVANVSALHGVAASVSSSSGRRTERASRSGSRPEIARSRAAVRSTRRATDGDSSATAGQTAGLRAARRAAAEQAARRAASLQSAIDASQRFEKTLSSRQWVLPTSGFHISVWFGEAGPYWSSGYHTGIDFATACGTPDVAVADATVAQTGWDGPYGNQIRLQFGNGDQIWYNHLSAIEVATGQAVHQGEQIGRVGETGNAFGCHTHIEYRLASNLHTPVDPLPFFESHGIQLR